MITLTLQLHPDGCLAAVRATGHAGWGKRGEDIVCAAAAALVRTAGRLLEAEPGLQAAGEAPFPGRVSLSLEKPPEERRERVRGITDFLVRGLLDLESEYPDNIAVEIGQRGRTGYGT